MRSQPERLEREFAQHLKLQASGFLTEGSGYRLLWQLCL